MNIVLVEPQIPPNTGNVGRLCAATRVPLHLVGDLGFRLTDRHLKRAGLDYWDLLTMRRHPSLEEFLGAIPESKLYFFSKKVERPYYQASFKEGDYLIFGSEIRGLPGWLFENYPDKFWTIPMFEFRVRSLNLATSVAIILYEALRQTRFVSNPSRLGPP